MYQARPTDAWILMFGLLAWISWLHSRRETGDLRLVFAAGAVVCAAISLFWLMHLLFIADEPISRRTALHSGMGTAAALLVGLCVFGAMALEIRGSRLSIPGIHRLDTILTGVAGAVAALFGAISLWPAVRCPVCGSRRCRCYGVDR